MRITNEDLNNQVQMINQSRQRLGLSGTFEYTAWGGGGGERKKYQLVDAGNGKTMTRVCHGKTNFYDVLYGIAEMLLVTAYDLLDA